MPKNQPWFPFYGVEWTDDPELNLCQHATQSIWLRAICAMHRLDTSSLIGTSEQLSRVLHCSCSEVLSAAADLRATRAADVNERDGNIILTSRRRVKEMRRKEICTNAGNISATRRKKDVENASDSNSEFDFDSGNGDTRGKGDDGDLPYTLDPAKLPECLKTPEFIAIWPEWVAHRAGKKKRLNRRSARMELKTLEEWGPVRAVAAVRFSIARAYEGIYENKSNGATKQRSGVSADAISEIASRVTRGKI